jgi:hypothetical protein
VDYGRKTVDRFFLHDRFFFAQNPQITEPFLAWA